MPLTPNYIPYSKLMEQIKMGPYGMVHGKENDLYPKVDRVKRLRWGERMVSVVLNARQRRSVFEWASYRTKRVRTSYQLVYTTFTVPSKFGLHHSRVQDDCQDK